MSLVVNNRISAVLLRGAEKQERNYINRSSWMFYSLKDLHRSSCMQESVQLRKINNRDDTNEGPRCENSQHCQLLGRCSECELLYLEDWQTEYGDVQEGVDNDSPEFELGVVNWTDSIGILGLSLPECLDGITVEKTQEGPAEEPDHRGCAEGDDGHTDPEQAKESPVQCED